MVHRVQLCALASVAVLTTLLRRRLRQATTPILRVAHLPASILQFFKEAPCLPTYLLHLPTDTNTKPPTPFLPPSSSNHDARTADHLHRAPCELRTSRRAPLQPLERTSLTKHFCLQLYLALYLQLIPLPTVIQTEIIPVVRSLGGLPRTPPPTDRPRIYMLTPRRYSQLPFWALVSFGAYLLVRLGWGVLTFNDVPEAHKELMGEIETAKVELRKLGVTVD